MQYGIMGLGMLQACLWVLFLNGPLLYQLDYPAQSPQTFLLVFLLINSLAYLMIGFAWNNMEHKYRERLSLSATIILSIGIIGLNFSAGSFFWFLLAAAAASLAVLICITGDVFIRLENNRSFLAYGGAVLIGTLLLFLSNCIASSSTLFILAACPWFAFYGIRKTTGQNNNPSEKAKVFRWQPFPFTNKFAVLLLFFYGAGGLMYRIVFLLPTVASLELFRFSNIVYCLVALLAAVWLYRQDNAQIKWIFTPILPSMGIGFLLLPYVNGNGYFFSFGLLQAGFALLDMYVWLVFVEMGKKEASSTVFGWGFFLVTFSILVGSVSYELLEPFLLTKISVINVLSVLAAIIMFMASVLVFGPLASQEAEPGNQPNRNIKPIMPMLEPEMVELVYPPAASMEAINMELTPSHNVLQLPEKLQPELEGGFEEDFMQTYKLTKREREILLLIIKGYNNPHMCETLNISINTLKTHLRNIYRKIGVEDRQDLINKYYG